MRRAPTDQHVPPTDQQIIDAVKTCIDEMKRAVAAFSSPSGETLEPSDDIDKWLIDCTWGNFKEKFDLWEDHENEVLGASRAIGQVAKILALLDGSDKIGKAHVRHAIIAVREHCGVGATRKKRRALCPEAEDMII